MVHRIGPGHLGEAPGEPPQGGEDRPDRLSEALPAVHGDQHLGAGAFRGRRDRQTPQGVDHRVAHHVDPLRGRPLGEQRLAGPAGGGEESGGQQVDHPPVGLLGEGTPEIARAQAGLDVPHPDAAMEGGEGGAHGGRSVPLDQQPVGAALGQDLVQGGQGARGQAVQGLVGAHQAEVEVGDEPEELLHLVQHLPVLAGGADGHLEAVRTPSQRRDDRGHLDRLGAGAVDRQDPEGAGGLRGGQVVLRAGRRPAGAQYTAISRNPQKTTPR